MIENDYGTFWIPIFCGCYCEIQSPVSPPIPSVDLKVPYEDGPIGIWIWVCVVYSAPRTDLSVELVLIMRGVDSTRAGIRGRYVGNETLR